MSLSIEERVRDIFVRHGVLTGSKQGQASNVTPKRGRKNRAKTGEAVTILDIIDAAEKLVPKRCVSYDLDLNLSQDMYAELIECYVEATLGELKLQDIQSTYDAENEWATVDFAIGDKRIHWEFSQIGDFMSLDLHDRLHRFLGAHVRGKFLAFPSTGQFFHCVYLPKAAAGELSHLVSSVSRA